MGSEKKFSLDDKYQLDEIKKHLENATDMLDIVIKVSEKDKSGLKLELEGRMSVEELAGYIDERKRALHSSYQKDELTGLFNSDYFEKRMATIDRSSVLPVAVINFNINSWKFVNDNFGDEQSDRLIEIISGIIAQEAKPYFVIGRMDGDIFGVLIPMALDGEAEEYVDKVVKRCDNYEDSILAPSVAAGIAYKTNIEQRLEDLMSDAEYSMFEKKYEMKNSPSYRERLEHGLKVNIE